MSKGFFVLLFLLAVLFTAVTFFYTKETTEILTDPGLADLVQRATLHGWPWGYYAEVTELVELGEGRVAVFEYGDVRWEKLGQTYLAWLIVSLLILSAFLVVAAPAEKGS